MAAVKRGAAPMVLVVPSVPVAAQHRYGQLQIRLADGSYVVGGMMVISPTKDQLDAIKSVPPSVPSLSATSQTLYAPMDVVPDPAGRWADLYAAGVFIQRLYVDASAIMLTAD